VALTKATEEVCGGWTWMDVLLVCSCVCLFVCLFVFKMIRLALFVSLWGGCICRRDVGWSFGFTTTIKWLLSFIEALGIARCSVFLTPHYACPCALDVTFPKTWHETHHKQTHAHKQTNTQTLTHKQANTHTHKTRKIKPANRCLGRCSHTPSPAPCPSSGACRTATTTSSLWVTG
jgi:hypothetical protein